MDKQSWPLLRIKHWDRSLWVMLLFWISMLLFDISSVSRYVREENICHWSMHSASYMLCCPIIYAEQAYLLYNDLYIWYIWTSQEYDCLHSFNGISTYQSIWGQWASIFHGWLHPSRLPSNPQICDIQYRHFLMGRSHLEPCRHLGLHSSIYPWIYQTLPW